MKKLYCIIWGKHRKFEEPKIYVLPFKKTWVLSIISGKCKNEVEKINKEDESTEKLRTFDLIENI